jgi:hypothetical protein
MPDMRERRGRKGIQLRVQSCSEKCPEDDRKARKHSSLYLITACTIPKFASSFCKETLCRASSFATEHSGTVQQVFALCLHLLSVYLGGKRVARAVCCLAGRPCTIGM